MTGQIGGLHHITGVSSDPQGNIEFYTEVLGMRLIKVTVNYDDPGTYHLYFGDRSGAPGSAITFFPFPGAERGKQGTGQATVVSYAVPEESFDFWIKHLARSGATFDAPAERFGEEYIALRDMDGQPIELIASKPVSEFAVWESGPVPPEFGISSFHSVTLSVANPEGTIQLLTDTMGFKKVSESENRMRFEIAGGGASRILDVLSLPKGKRGIPGAGTIHHVAWRTPTPEDQIEWRSKIAELRYHITPVVERNYFKSVYFREKSGILFEIATDTPGFAVDEPVEQFGTKIMLPPWMESRRQNIEAMLPTIRFPKSTVRSADVAK